MFGKYIKKKMFLDYFFVFLYIAYASPCVRVADAVAGALVQAPILAVYNISSFALYFARFSRKPVTTLAFPLHCANTVLLSGAVHGAWDVELANSSCITCINDRLFLLAKLKLVFLEKTL